MTDICEILYKHNGENNKLLDALRIHFNKVEGYDRIECACSIASILPVTQIEADSFPLYKELINLILPFLKDVDFFAVTLHFFTLFDLSSSSLLIRKILIMLGEKSEILKQYQFFCKKIPQSLLKIYKPSRTKVMESYSFCIDNMVENGVMNIEEVRGVIEEDELQKFTKLKISEEKSLCNHSLDFVGSNCEDAKDSLHVRIRSEEETKSALQRIQSNLRINDIFESHNEGYRDINEFIEFAKKRLLKQPQEIPDFKLTTFLPIKYMLNQCIAIFTLSPENNVYNILRKVQGALVDINIELRKDYDRLINVACYNLSDIREKYWMPYLMFKVKKPENPISIKFYVNHHILKYGGILIEKYLTLNTKIETVCLYIYSWASKRGLVNSDQGYFSSYGLYLLIIFFLQIVDKPVISSLQKYAENTMKERINKEVIDIRTLKYTPSINNYKIYPKDSVRFHAFNDSFVDIDVSKVVMGYSNNDNSTQLVVKFFDYFVNTYPNVSRTLQMSVKAGTYVLVENSKMNEKFAFLMEDPILSTYNPLNTILFGSKEYFRIINEFKKGYEVLLEYDKADILLSVK